MSADLTAVIVAVVGVGGTLTSPLLAQRMVIRGKQLQISERHQRRREERAEERLAKELQECRDASVALNITARGFRQALKNCAYEPSDQTRTELEQARLDFTRSCGEMQLVLSEPVLACAATVSGYLATAYGRVKEFLSSQGAPDAARRDEIEAYLDGEVHDAIRELRRIMRTELGVDAGPAAPWTRYPRTVPAAMAPRSKGGKRAHR
jgi:hypothetical protein